MAGRKRKKAQREQDLEFVAQLIGEGIKSTITIAERLNAARGYDPPLTDRQVRVDRKELYRRWSESQIVNTDLERRRVLNEVDAVKRNAWESFRRSKTDHVRKNTETERGNDEGGGPSTIQKVNRIIARQTGDASFLRVVLECLDKESKLLNIEPAQRLELSGSIESHLEGNVEISVAQYERILEKLPLEALEIILRQAEKNEDNE